MNRVCGFRNKVCSEENNGGLGALALQDLNPALFGFDEGDVDDLLKNWDEDLAYLDSLIRKEQNRDDLNSIFSQHGCFFTLIDHFYFEVQKDLQASEFHSISSSVSISSSEELSYSQLSDPEQTSPNRRGRRRQYFGENRKWATWRNNWVYNQRKQIQSEIRKAELQYLSMKNQNLDDELFELLLDFELVKENYCGFNQGRILAASEDCRRSSQICQCRRTGNPCPDLFSVTSPQAQ
ncbi:hypothetical protein FO519_009184 [Halicephalobus sp. NKZ332]|nr:hypothetical protein FO519_009184 [Halicephalobus sp. NKZ332]